ncbi:MAG: bifunctional phosphopantothenoylcysteine decarboxylase/phosphopantothenate--cysteine ligase CoaBC [Steroidobacteraceae bacterium]
MNAMRPLRVLLGVTGGIAAYKSPEIVRRLRDIGVDVQVVMTAGAGQFVGPLTFQAVSGHPVRDSLWDASAEAAMGHIELARWPDIVLIAPATAEVLAGIAHGHADDLLTTLCLATDRPLHVAPAMNRLMWSNAATQANVATLLARGVHVHGPAEGGQACGETGPGRMLEPVDLVSRIAAVLPRTGPLAGRKVVITAGPTRECIDPVRFISNRSSGKMGYAVAQAAFEAGANVVLVTGPVAIAKPPGVECVSVESAARMHEAVHAAIGDADIFIGAAAVADYRPKRVAEQKIKKTSDAMTIDLTRAPDILASVAALARRPFVVGFAAETEKIEEHARSKLERKKLDMIAANYVGNGRAFDREDNALVVLWPGGRRELDNCSKIELARRLIACIVERFAAAGPGRRTRARRRGH